MRRNGSIGFAIASTTVACVSLLTQAAWGESMVFVSDIIASGSRGFTCASNQDRATETANHIYNLSGGQPWRILTTEANNCYDSAASYTTFQSKWRNYLPGYPILPVPGNHDYLTSSGADDHLATAFKNYFGATWTPFAEYVGNDWLVIGLDSELDGLTDPMMEIQATWLWFVLYSNAISEHKRPCILAFSHKPAYSNAKKHPNDRLDPALVGLLQEYRATLLLSGHEHVYERLAPHQGDGLIQIVAGTGGAALNPSPAFYQPGDPQYVPSVVQDNTTHGVLYLGLWDRVEDYPASYFVVFTPSHGNQGDAIFGQCNQ